MIRPSALTLAEKCGLASRLAERYPESSGAAQRGTMIHGQIAGSLTMLGDTMPPHAGARAAVEVVLGMEGCRIEGVEVKLRLMDPLTDTLITEGTADLIMETQKGPLVIDHKTGRPEHVTPPVDNLQLHAYGLAAAARLGSGRYSVQILHVDDTRAWLGERYDVVGPVRVGIYMDRVRKAAAMPAEAVRGPHCETCYQQRHCPAYMLPAHGGPSALTPFTVPGGLTTETAPRAIQVIEAMEAAVRLAKERLKNYVRENGPVHADGSSWGPVMTSGRRSGPSVTELQGLGLGHLVKAGAPYPVYKWRKVADGD